MMTGSAIGTCYRCRRTVGLWHHWEGGRHKGERRGHCRACFEEQPETWLACRICRQEREATPGGPWHLDPGGKWVPLEAAAERDLAALAAHMDADDTFGYEVLLALGWWPPGRRAPA